MKLFLATTLLLTGHFSAAALDISCTGYGISDDFARQDAIERCQGSAAAYLSRDLEVKSENWETSESAYSLTRAKSASKIKNLECKVLQEKIRSSNTTTEIELSCRFDTSKTSVKGDLWADDSNDSQPKQHIGQKNPGVKLSRERKLAVISIPPCQAVTTIGPQGKTQLCSGNPSYFTVSSDDREVVVEREGFLPRRVKLNLAEEIITNVTVRLVSSD